MIAPCASFGPLASRQTSACALLPELLSAMSALAASVAADESPYCYRTHHWWTRPSILVAFTFSVRSE